MESDDETRPAKGAVEDEAPATNGWIKRCLTIRDKPSFLERIGFGLAGVAVILAIWFVLTAGPPAERIIGPITLPSIGETAASFHELWFDRALARSALASLGRVLGGFLLAAAIAIPTGVVASSYLRMNAFFRPLSVFGRNVPIAALIPLTLIWFGIGETQKIMFIFLATVAFIFFDTTHAVRQVSDRFLDTAYTLGAGTVPARAFRRTAVIAFAYGTVLAFVWSLLTGGAEGVFAVDRYVTPGFFGAWVVGFFIGFLIWFPIQNHQVIHKVLLPLSMPNIVNSLRLLFGLAFGYIMLAEVINAKLGLGHIILMSQRRPEFKEHIYLCLIIIAVLAFSIDRVVLWAQKRWFPYIQHDEG